MHSRPVIALAIPIGAIIGAGVLIFVISRILITAGYDDVFTGTRIPITPFIALAIAFIILIGATIVAGRYETPENH